MGRGLILAAIAFVLVSGVVAIAAEISLGRIWAHRIPGTRDVQELEPKLDAQQLEGLAKDRPASERVQWIRDEVLRRSEVASILELLRRRPVDGESAKKVLVIRGSGKEALTNAVTALADANKQPSEFPLGTNLSLMFYSYPSGRYVHLVSVDRWSNVITVRYRFVSHVTMETTQHFALIPLGKLDAGEYKVLVERVSSPTDGRVPAAEESKAQQLVSGSTRFFVRKE